MTPERWQKIRDLLCDALEVAPEQRSAFLDSACLADSGLRSEVESLLSSQGKLPSSFLRSPPVTSSTLMQGTKLGAYNIICLLGAGGMGEVYRAHDSKLGREVALKVLPPRTAADPDRLKRFQREARAVAALNHPHIVTIYSVEETSGTHFLTMELVDGIALDHLIPERGLPLEKIFEIAIPIAEALAAAHEKRIVHRDLKPANIMVDKKRRVKVLDFGLAKVGGMSSDGIDNPASPESAGGLDLRLETQTQAGSVMGTLPYMSPEQLRGQPVGPRSDLFSFGAVLYEMTVGQPPFSGETSTGFISSILQSSPRPVTDLRTDVPFGLQEILDSCLAKNPHDRYASAHDLLEAIEELRHEITLGQNAITTGRVVQDSVAVLPFTNMSADPENEFFADGITEEIINALAQIEQLHVAARSSAFSFKGKQTDLRIIGERLKVRSVLTGSVRRSEGRLRITAQLQNVADGYQLWSERYDRDVKDVFAIQDEIARSIVDRLKVTLEGKRLGPLAKVGTKSLEAYQLYVKGRALLSRRGSAIPSALECFKHAVTLDTEYALAWAGLADCYTLLDFYALARPEVGGQKGKDAAQRAMILDPSLAEAHSAMGCACLLYDLRFAEAEREYLLALELNPRNVQARGQYAFFYLQLAVGRLDEGIAQAALALESDPLSGYANALVGMTYFNAGRYSEALPAFDRALELDPDSFLARYFRCCTLHFSGHFEDAVARGEEVLTMSGRQTGTMAILASIFMDWGKPSEADAIYTELTARARREYVPPSYLVIAAHALGLQEEALAQARHAMEIRDPCRHLMFSKYFPYGARLHRDARCRELLRDSGFE
jgi:serine/threonine protein kinase/tetratricopeptide (TPR) repeat protein